MTTTPEVLPREQEFEEELQLPPRRLETLSPIEKFAMLPEAERKRKLSKLSPEEAKNWMYAWSIWARPEQLPPTGEWRTWVILAGRGFGKTRAGAEFIRAEVMAGRAKHVALVGRTVADVRDVMVEGPSGLLNIGPPEERPLYQPALRKLTWPNGAIAMTYSADEPGTLRGPQHDLAWLDELSSWRFPEAFDNLQFGLRMGDNPRQVITTTPKPNELTKKVMAKRLIDSGSTVVSRGSTFDNIANLARGFIEETIAPYVGTRIGQQELFAEILDRVEGALWTPEMLDMSRVRVMPPLDQIVVAIDPAVSNSPGANETGIIVAGRAGRDAYVFGDFSVKGSPDEWIKTAKEAYDIYDADLMVAEVNQGGGLVESLLRTLPGGSTVKFETVWAHEGKMTRAHPISLLYEHTPSRVHHVGYFAELESQLCTWEPASGSKSPDRLDALVWAITKLLGQKQKKVARVL